ncbi:MAG: hypothetical protein ABEJ66_00345, partial [Candidatus Nanohaloarchaea archaeon]
VIKNRDLDAVEKFRRGNEQYDGHLPFLELANDDAHNIYEVGSSFMQVEVDKESVLDVTWGDVFREIRSGRVTMINQPKGLADRFFGQVEKGLSMLSR